MLQITDRATTQLLRARTKRGFDEHAGARFVRGSTGVGLMFAPAPLPGDQVPGGSGLDLGSSHVGIGLETGVADAPRPRPISLWVYTDDCDALVERIRTSGGTITEDPTDQPWGERVARVVDPDGNQIIIGQRPGT